MIKDMKKFILLFIFFGSSFGASALTCTDILEKIKDINQIEIDHIEGEHCTYNLGPLDACDTTNKSQFDTHYCHTHDNMFKLIKSTLSDPGCKVYDNTNNPGTYEFVGNSGVEHGIGATYSKIKGACVITDRAKGYYNPNGNQSIGSFFPFVPKLK